MKMSLATLHLHTEQQVFDHVTTHLRRQGHPAKVGELCSYRVFDEEGRGTVAKCAAGSLIADDEYRCAYEGMNWSDLISYRPFVFPTTHQPLITRLQKIHDHYGEFDWEMKFEELAREFRLVYAKQ